MNSQQETWIGNIRVPEHTTQIHNKEHLLLMTNLILELDGLLDKKVPKIQNYEADEKVIADFITGIHTMQGELLCTKDIVGIIRVVYNKQYTEFLHITILRRLRTLVTTETIRLLTQ